MTDIADKTAEIRLGLAVWDAIADAIHRAGPPDRPSPEQLEQAAERLRNEPATKNLFSPASLAALSMCPVPRSMAAAYLDFLTGPSGESFTKLEEASRAYEQSRIVGNNP